MSSHDHVVLPVRTTFIIYGILLGLMGLTIAAAYIDLGPIGLSVAMGIASVKAVLILLYFMHVRFSNPLVWIFSTAAFFWLLILLALTFNDYFTRGWLDTLGK